MDVVQKDLEENVTLEVSEIALNIQTATDCFSVSNPFNVLDEKNFFVKDTNGKLLGFRFDDNYANITIETSVIPYYIYYANANFETKTLPQKECDAPERSAYFFGAPRLNEFYSIEKLEGIKNAYDTDYIGLKNQLGFPVGSDFSISITDILTKQEFFKLLPAKPARVEVYASEIPIQVMQRDGTIINAILNLQVW